MERRARRKIAKKQRKRARARCRRTRIRTLRAHIMASKVRCTCHDFDFWADIWKRSPAAVKRLRQCCHAATCELYSPGDHADCALEFLQTPGALCCPSSGRPLRIHHMVSPQLQGNPTPWERIEDWEQSRDRVDFEDPCEEDDLTDDEYHSDVHWVEKDQKSVSSQAMRLDRSYCKQVGSGNWCDCPSVHHCNVFSHPKARHSTWQ